MGNCALVLNDLAVVPTAEEIKCDSVPRTNSKNTAAINPLSALNASLQGHSLTLNFKFPSL